jgi:vacuolar fusion protein MON1
VSDDCDAALLLISADSESFFTLSAARKNIIDKMSRSNYFDPITEGAKNRGICLKTVGVTDIRHFLYKNKRNTQLLTSEITTPYDTLGEKLSVNSQTELELECFSEEFERLEALYYDLHNRIHRSSRPLKLIYEMSQQEIKLAWVTSNYEFYAIFEPLVDKKSLVIAQVNKLLKFIKTQEEKLFITANHVF